MSKQTIQPKHAPEEQTCYARAMARQDEARHRIATGDADADIALSLGMTADQVAKLRRRYLGME